MKKVTTILSGILATAVLLTGCQSISGTNINNVLINHSSMKSYESNQLLKIDFLGTPDNSLDNEYESILLKLIDNMEIKYHTITENSTNVYIEGTIKLSKGSIPFKLSMNDKESVIILDNAKKPIVVKNNEISTVSIPSAEKIKDEVTKFIIKNLPNPTNIKLTQEKVNINNEDLNLNKLSSEIRNHEVLPLITNFIKNLMSDKQGIQELLLVINKEIPELFNMSDEDLIKVYTSEFYPQLEELAKEISVVNPSDIDQAVNKDSYLKADIYFDNNIKIRKVDSEIQVKLSDELQSSMNGYDGIKINLETDYSKINEAIDAPSLSSENGIIVDENVNRKDIMNSLPKNGVLYDVLQNDLKINRERTYMPIGSNEFYTYTFFDINTHYSTNKTVVKNGTTFVPLRTVSEILHGKVEWDAKTKNITISKDNNVIVVKAGQNTATVNGKKVNIVAPFVENDTTMIPIRFISENLGATVSWDGSSAIVTLD